MDKKQGILCTTGILRSMEHILAIRKLKFKEMIKIIGKHI